MPEAGWYRDPNHRSVLRWYDGERWTDDLLPTQGSAAPDPTWQQVATREVTRSLKWLVYLSVAALIAVVVGGLVFMSVFYEGRNDGEDAIGILLGICQSLGRLNPFVAVQTSQFGEVLF